MIKNKTSIERQKKKKKNQIKKKEAFFYLSFQVPNL